MRDVIEPGVGYAFLVDPTTKPKKWADLTFLEKAWYFGRNYEALPEDQRVLYYPGYDKRCYSSVTLFDLFDEAQRSFRDNVTHPESRRAVNNEDFFAALNKVRNEDPEQYALDTTKFVEYGALGAELWSEEDKEKMLGLSDREKRIFDEMLTTTVKYMYNTKSWEELTMEEKEKYYDQGGGEYYYDEEKDEYYDQGEGEEYYKSLYYGERVQKSPVWSRWSRWWPMPRNVLLPQHFKDFDTLRAHLYLIP